MPHSACPSTVTLAMTYDYNITLAGSEKTSPPSARRSISPLADTTLGPNAATIFTYGMVWYSMVWYGMVCRNSLENLPIIYNKKYQMLEYHAIPCCMPQCPAHKLHGRAYPRQCTGHYSVSWCQALFKISQGKKKISIHFFNAKQSWKTMHTLRYAIMRSTRDQTLFTLSNSI